MHVSGHSPQPILPNSDETAAPLPVPKQQPLDREALALSAYQGALQLGLQSERLLGTTPAPVGSERDPANHAASGNESPSESWGFFDLFTAVGSAIAGGAQIAADALASCAKFAAGGVSEACDCMEAMGSRAMDASRSLVQGALGATTGIFHNLKEAGSTFADGVSLLFQGNSSGFGELGRSLLKVVQTPVDAALVFGGSALGAAQTLTFLEAPGRRLTEEEVAALEPIFGDSVDYERVRVKEGSAGLFGVSDRPFTLGNTIYMNDVGDRSSTAFREDLNVLVSEVTHVWQHQNGGTDYTSEALLSQWFGKGYDWQRDVPGTPWPELQPEQQDAFLAYAHNAGAFDQSPPAFPPEAVPAGMTRQDLNQYLTNSLAWIRAGSGTP